MVPGSCYPVKYLFYSESPFRKPLTFRKLSNVFLMGLIPTSLPYYLAEYPRPDDAWRFDKFCRNTICIIQFADLPLVYIHCSEIPKHVAPLLALIMVEDDRERFLYFRCGCN